MEMEITFEEPIKVNGQKLFVDVRVVKLLSEASLTISDLDGYAQSICQWMKKKGWFSLNHPIAFVVDQIPPSKTIMLFCYQPAKIDSIGSGIESNTLGVISVASDTFKKEVLNAQTALANYKGNDPTKLLKEMLRGSIGLSICHEMCHAFGINTMNELFKSLKLEELELLTDCSAYSSCSELIGAASAYLGASYIHAALKQKGVKINAVSVKQQASTVIANADY